MALKPKDDLPLVEFKKGILLFRDQDQKKQWSLTMIVDGTKPITFHHPKGSIDYRSKNLSIIERQGDSEVTRSCRVEKMYKLCPFRKVAISTKTLGTLYTKNMIEEWGMSEETFVLEITHQGAIFEGPDNNPYQWELAGSSGGEGSYTSSATIIRKDPENDKTIFKIFRRDTDGVKVSGYGDNATSTFEKTKVHIEDKIWSDKNKLWESKPSGLEFPHKAFKEFDEKNIPLNELPHSSDLVPLIKFKKDILVYQKKNLSIMIDGKSLEPTDICSPYFSATQKSKWFGKIRLTPKTWGYLYCELFESDVTAFEIRIEPTPPNVVKSIPLAGHESGEGTSVHFASIIHYDDLKELTVFKLFEYANPKNGITIKDYTWSDTNHDWVSISSHDDLYTDSYRKALHLPENITIKKSAR